MDEYKLKFIFLKTPQIRHNFKSNYNIQLFPIIIDEVYQAELKEENYEFIGKSNSGSVSKKDFINAMGEGYISLITN